MPFRLEKYTEDDLKTDVRKDFGIESIKLNLTGNKGWPDRMFLLPLRPAFVEVKRVGEKPYKLQVHRIKQMLSLGYDVIWTDSYEDAYKWIGALHAARVSEAGYPPRDWSRSRGIALRPGPWKD